MLADTNKNAFVVEFQYTLPVPSVVYATYFGSSGVQADTSARGVAVDATTGDAFVVGDTFARPFWTAGQSPVFWTVLGATGGDEAWVAKFDATGNPASLQGPYDVFIAGQKDDRATAVALVPQSGLPPKLYVAGWTYSNDAANGDQFPATQPPNRLQAFNQGAAAAVQDAFLALLNPSGDPTQSIQFLGYIGGSSDDRATGVALDPGGTNAWVAGLTSSTDFRFGNVNGMQLTAGGGFWQGFVVSVSP
jgi:hypothetical protein